jgi:hypothetical protein
LRAPIADAIRPMPAGRRAKRKLRGMVAWSGTQPDERSIEEAI